MNSITIGNGLTSLGFYAFLGCDSLSVYITNLSMWCKIKRDDESKLTYKLFLNNKELTELTIPKDVTKIENYTFLNCLSIVKINIGEHVMSIGDEAFAKCAALKTIEIPNNVTYLGSYAFYECDSLTSVSIGNGISSINSGTFSGCSSLKKVIIGENITEIGDYAFVRSPIKEFYCYPTTPPKLNKDIISYTLGSTLYIPANSEIKYLRSDWRAYFSTIKEMD